MPLESVTFISDLVATNPVNATDQVAQGDDHLRNIKLALLNTFPSITGAVTATHTAINQTAVGTGGTFPAINGSALTALNGTNITSGTVADARLSANVPLLNAINVFTAPAQQFSNNSGPYLSLVDGDAAAGQGWRLRSTGGTFILSSTNAADSLIANAIVVTSSAAAITDLSLTATAITLNGVNVTDFARLSQANTFTDPFQQVTGTNARWDLTDGTVVARFMASTSVSAAVFGSTSNHAVSFRSNNIERLVIDSAGNYDFKAGTLATNNASASEVGYKGAPQNVQNGNYTLVLADAGKSIVKQSGGAGETITIPANASVAFPVGTVVLISNKGGGTLSVAITTDTLSLGGTTTTGTRTLADGALATLYKDSATSWTISGAGVS